MSLDINIALKHKPLIHGTCSWWGQVSWHRSTDVDEGFEGSCPPSGCEHVPFVDLFIHGFVQSTRIGHMKREIRQNQIS